MSIKPEDYKDEFLKESKRLLEEARELLDRLKKGSAGKAEILEKLFTIFHNLKGTAATLKFEGLASAFIPIDKQISAAYKEKRDITEDDCKKLLERIDAMMLILNGI